MDVGELSGKLLCFKCNTRFGSYDWAGNQCSCGVWVVPAIQVPKSKVDVRKVVNKSMDTPSEGATMEEEEEGEERGEGINTPIL